MQTTPPKLTQAELLADQIERSVIGPAWFGPSWMDAVAGVNAEQAAFQLDPDSHNIWQLTMHLNNWVLVLHRRLKGETVGWPPDQEDWPVARNLTQAEWKEAREKAQASHVEFARDAKQLSDIQLDRQVPGKDYNVRFMLHGIAQHVAYHTGQIVVIKKHLAR